MALALVLFDLDRTLITPEGGLAPGIEGLLRFLARRKLPYAALSSRPRQEGEPKLARHGLEPAVFCAAEDLAGGADPFAVACAGASCTIDQVLYVGHAEFPMATVVGSQVLFFNAAWAGTEAGFGRRVASPREVEVLLDLYLCKQQPWQVTLEPAARRSLHVHAVIDGRAGGKSPLKELLLECFKYRKPVQDGRLARFLREHLLASLSLSGVARRVDAWTLYPGHVTGSANPFLDPSLAAALPRFLERYVPDLLIRHRDAEPSFQQKQQAPSRAFSNQLSTMHVNPDRQQDVPGRTWLVLDDFIHEGSSAEWARQALLAAGAKDVIVCAAAKFGDTYRTWTHPAPAAWEVCKPGALMEEDFTAGTERVRHDRAASNELLASWKRLAGGIWTGAA